jgi:hypothetical protein
VRRSLRSRVDEDILIQGMPPSHGQALHPETPSPGFAWQTERVVAELEADYREETARMVKEAEEQGQRELDEHLDQLQQVRGKGMCVLSLCVIPWVVGVVGG